MVFPRLFPRCRTTAVRRLNLAQIHLMKTPPSGWEWLKNETHIVTSRRKNVSCLAKFDTKSWNRYMHSDDDSLFFNWLK